MLWMMSDTQSCTDSESENTPKNLIHFWEYVRFHWQNRPISWHFLYTSNKYNLYIFFVCLREIYNSGAMLLPQQNNRSKVASWPEFAATICCAPLISRNNKYSAMSHHRSQYVSQVSLMMHFIKEATSFYYTFFISFLFFKTFKYILLPLVCLHFDLPLNVYFCQT